MGLPIITTLLEGTVGKVIDKGMGIIDKFVPDKDLAATLKAELNQARLNIDHTEAIKGMDASMQVILAEAKGGSWIQRNWRPITMLTFVYIIAHNYIFAPIFSLQSLEIPPDMWALLKIGMGGYIIGRSAERGIKEWKK